ncbi:MAG: Wadjet anti-phage system protein JetD domain-containing protein [Oscillochloridaceae bacterium umkhey_bin13]
MHQADLPALARAILTTLLERAEQPGRRQVVRVRITRRDHESYYSAQDANPRQATNRALSQCAAIGLITLHWQRWEEQNWLEAVDLQPGGLTALYALLGRTPRDTQEQALLRLLAAQQPQAPWQAAFVAWAQERISAGKTAPPLERADLVGSADLLTALAGLAELRTPTLERALSVRLFRDSKRLAGLRSGIIRVLRQHDPETALYGDDDAALLRAYLLERVPEYVPIAGPLTLCPASGGPSLDLSPFVPSLALPSVSLRNAAMSALEAEAVLTVENLTSFSEAALIRPANLLLLYTGGFASPSLIGLLRTVRSYAPTIKLWHWGDLDAGGLRILAHLRRQIGPVAALAMDAATLVHYQAASQPLTAGDRRALEELRNHSLLTDQIPLIDQLLANGCKLEQEAIAAEDVLGRLAV